MQSSLALRASAEIELRRRGLIASEPQSPKSFEQFASEVHPRYSWYWHCRTIANVLDRVVSGELRRVMVFAPPRHGKSELVSRLFPAYFLHRHPDRWVALASYGAELAYTLSRAARGNYIRAGHPLASDAAAVKHWQTERGGGLWACGVRGPATGKGFHLGVVDDPVKDRMEAESPRLREAVRDWWRSVWLTRAEPDAALVVIQTRWHEDDLAGWLLSQEGGESTEGWHIVNLPAIAEDTPQVFPSTCTLEPDPRAPGAALCPERYPVDVLRGNMAKAGSYAAASLYQQRPSPPEGRRFKRSWFEIVDAVPAGARRVRWWDKAATDGDGDWTVGQLVAFDGETLYVEDEIRGQWGPGERDRIIRQTAEIDRQRLGYLVETCGPQDPGAAGKTDALAFRRLLQGFRVHTETETGDKELRADVWRAMAEVGSVKLLRGPWNAGWLDEIVSFPGRVDDRVDAVSGAAARLLSQPRSSLMVGRA